MMWPAPRPVLPATPGEGRPCCQPCQGQPGGDKWGRCARKYRLIPFSLHLTHGCPALLCPAPSCPAPPHLPRTAFHLPACLYPALLSGLAAKKEEKKEVVVDPEAETKESAKMATAMAAALLVLGATTPSVAFASMLTKFGLASVCGYQTVRYCLLLPAECTACTACYCLASVYGYQTVRYCLLLPAGCPACYCLPMLCSPCLLLPV